MKVNKYIDIDLENDFGFTTHSEESIIEPVTDEVSDLKQRLEAIRKIYLPLLQHLAKNADQPIIKWPNRGPVLDNQIKKLLSLTEPGFKEGS